MDKDLVSTIVCISSALVVSVSIASFFIAYSQMRIASVRTKLDLYNKRFNIYLTALDLYQATWHETHERIRGKSIEFTRSYRESSFLFDVKDGVYETLGKIQQNAATIYGYEKMKSDIENGESSDRDALSALHSSSIRARDEFTSNLTLFEQQLKKYIQFTNIKGWKLFG
jgi:hypothetical protein